MGEHWQRLTVEWWQGDTGWSQKGGPPARGSIAQDGGKDVRPRGSIAQVGTGNVRPIAQVGGPKPPSTPPPARVISGRPPAPSQAPGYPPAPSSASGYYGAQGDKGHGRPPIGAPKGGKASWGPY